MRARALARARRGANLQSECRLARRAQGIGRMLPLSILDLAPVLQGHDASDAFARSRDLAQHAERWGYRRFWLAEHHGMPGIASAATSVVMAHVADGTSTIRVGAGGIMLPNHSPLVIAEQFGTLAALYPGRIDLGLGRAPGSDPVVARALRRSPTAGDDFPQDVVELLGYFEDAHPDHVAGTRIVEDARFDAKLTKSDLPGDPIYPKWLFHYYATHLRIVPQPSFIVDTTGFAARKREAVLAYRSQFVVNDFQHHLRRFNGSEHVLPKSFVLNSFREVFGNFVVYIGIY